MRKNHKTLIRYVKEELNKWTTLPYPWTGRLNIVRMSVLLKLIYRFNIILIKIPASYFVDINKLILKWRGKRSRVANSILKESNKVGELTPPDSKPNLKATVTERVRYW